MKRITRIFLILCIMIMSVGVGHAEDVTYDASDFDNLSGRTAEDVRQRYAAAVSAGDTYIERNSSTYYSVPASTSYPYYKGDLSEDTLASMAAMTDFYRWLIGVEPITVNTVSDDSQQAQCLDRNFEFNHLISDDSKPADMPDEIWNEGKACNHNILAWGYTPTGAVTGWLNEGYNYSSSSFGTIGHRTAILNAYNTGIVYGYSGSIATGKTIYGSNTFTNAFSAFPGEGYFPSNLVSYSQCAWTVQLNTQYLSVADASAVSVKVTDLTTEESYTCTTGNGYLSCSAGSAWLIFRQPKPASGSTYTDSYKVEVTGLKDVAGSGSAKAVYTVWFFDAVSTIIRDSAIRLENDDVKYTGSAVAPSFTVVSGGVTLTEGVDYTVSYKNNTNAGTGWVYVTGKGSYAGTAKAFFTIRPDTKNVADLKIGSIGGYTYNGSPHLPKPTVSDFGEKLTENVDYVLSYKNNINAGKATVVITGKGKYSGSTEVEFTIYKAYPSATPEFTTLEKGGSCSIKTIGDGAVTFSSEDTGVVSVSAGGVMTAVSEGETKVTVTFSEGSNYYASTRNFTVTVSASAHMYDLQSVENANGSDNIVKLHYKCRVCGATKTEEKTTLTSLTVYFRVANVDDNYYYSYIAKNQAVGTEVYTMNSYSPGNAEIKDIEVISSDPSVIEVSGSTLLFKKKGTATVTYRVKYNPSVSRSYTFNVGHIYGDWVVSGDKVTSTCSLCGDVKSIIRYSGSGRYETSLKAADAVKTVFASQGKLSSGKFKNIVIASGENYADALAGSYLAVKKDAPVILTANGSGYSVMTMITDYVKANLAEGGSIYVLGGYGAVSEMFETKMGSEYAGSIVRLAGGDRYETNIMILDAAGVSDGEDILICTGLSYADSLSASAAGRPILLVPGNRLLKNKYVDQEAYLRGLAGSHDIYIIGGTGAVTEDVFEAVSGIGIGNVKRVFGSDRFGTSAAVAAQFFDNPSELAFSYSHNFPDGLSAGPLANACKAPLLLVRNGAGAVKTAMDYVSEYAMNTGTVRVMGGETLISNESIENIISVVLQ